MMPQQQATVPSASADMPDGTAPEKSYAYSWYVTSVLMVAYMLSFLDRQVINLMVGPIKADLRITDTQFAMLTGLAFGLFYTVAVLPIGWLADRRPRRGVIAIGIAIWSVATAACGLARSFAGLFFTRIGVGIGEAALSPCAYSMMSDMFDRSRLPRAMSIYALGIYLGAGLAMIVGGMLVAALADASWLLPITGLRFTWQLVFVAVGLPGLFVSLWILTLREPKRRAVAPGDANVPRFALWHFARRHPRMMVALYFGSGMLAVFGNMEAWYPELFIRTHGWGVKETGWVNGLSALVAGPAGMLTAGMLAGRMIRSGRGDACLRLTAWSAALVVIPGVAMPLMPDPWAAAALLFPLKFFVGFTPVLIPAAIQIIAPGAIRAQLGALFVLSTGLVGISFGPLLPALIGDYILHDERQLGLSLAITAASVAPIALLILLSGLREYGRRVTEIDAQ